MNYYTTSSVEVEQLYENVIAARQRYCLATLNKIIEDPPSQMEQTIQEYEELEATWKKDDEMKGFDFEVFKNQNRNFLKTLKRICKEMNSDDE